MLYTKLNNCECNSEWRQDFESYESKNENRKNGYLGEIKLLSNAETQCAIIEGINEKKGFWASRFGENELGAIYEVFEGQYRLNLSDRRHRYEALCNNAGFFPKKTNEIEKYVELMVDSMPGIDLHGAWPLKMEDYFKDKFFPNARCAYFGDFEPYSAAEGVLPWTSALSEKKVLVIHPFAELIEEQYKNKRTEIFASTRFETDDILPVFDLKTLKAVQTIAGNRDSRFTTWFDALDWMSEECNKIDFDVAIVGCGAYGFPLSGRIKGMGKKAIQLCGATQILFGIMGQRWEGIPGVAAMKNDSWVRPGKRECISSADAVEEGCYW